jgi:hypothetical protein
MINKTKLVLIVATLAVTRLAATPALGQTYSSGFVTGNLSPFSSQSAAPRNASRHGVHNARRNGLHAYAMEPRPQSNFAPGTHTSVDSDDPAFTGGGSVGYNELLKQEGD